MRLNWGLVLGLMIVAVTATESLSSVPQSGFITYSRGDAAARTLYRRMCVNGQMQGEEMICQRGSDGGDIQGVISHDGKWLAFSRSLPGTASSYGGNDYHSFDKWDVYIVSLEGTLPKTPTKVAHGYFPSWGNDSHGATKTLYYCVKESFSIYKATISSTGGVSGITKHFDVPTTEGDLHMMGSPDGQKVAYREGGTVYIRHISGPLAGQKKNAGGGCHPSWTADSRWLIHANRTVCRDDGMYLNSSLGGAGEYHYGTSQDLKWFITKTEGDWQSQNTGQQVHIMPLSVTETSFVTNTGAKTEVTNDGSWVDVHVGDVAPPDVAIDAFWAEPASVTPGASTTLNWTVRNATAVKLDGAVVTGTSKAVTPAQTVTYTLSAEGTGGPKTKTVSVTVTAPVLTSIVLTPATATVNLGQTVQFSAAPKDQVGNPIAATITWTTVGIGSVAPSTGASAVFTAPTGEAGSATVTATSGSVTASAQVKVVDPDAIRFQINCGGPTIGDWVGDAAYVVTGNTGDPYDFEASTTTGVTSPAPADVYRTVRHMDHAYLFGDIADGSYTVRIHFTDFAGTGRLMNYSIEGTSVLSNFNPATEAGGTGKVIVKEFPNVIVSGNDGMSIEATAGSGNDVFEAAIEIIGNGSTMAPGTIIVTGPNKSLLIGEELTISWRASADVGSVRIGLLLQPDGELITLTQESIDQGTPQWGSYTMVIPQAILGQSVVSNAAMVQVVDYANGDVFGESEPFAILAGSTARSAGLVAGVSTPYSLIRSARGEWVVSFTGSATHSFEIFNLNGALLHRASGSGIATYTIQLPDQALVVRMSQGGRSTVSRAVVRN